MGGGAGGRGARVELKVSQLPVQWVIVAQFVAFCLRYGRAGTMVAIVRAAWCDAILRKCMPRVTPTVVNYCNSPLANEENHHCRGCSGEEPDPTDIYYKLHMRVTRLGIPYTTIHSHMRCSKNAATNEHVVNHELRT